MSALPAAKLTPETKKMSNFKNISDIINYFKLLKFKDVMYVRSLNFRLRE